jgi:hypothetical protein
MPPEPKRPELAQEKYLANPVSTHEAKVPKLKPSQVDELGQLESPYVAS